MDFLRELHGTWAIAVIVLNLAAAVWGLLATLRNWPLPRAFWLLIIAAQASIIPQVVAGVLLWSGGSRPVGGWTHLIYGAAALLGVAVGLSYFFGTRMRRRPALLFGLVSLFIFLATFRGFLTGLGVM